MPVVKPRSRRRAEEGEDGGGAGSGVRALITSLLLLGFVLFVIFSADDPREAMGQSVMLLAVALIGVLQWLAARWRRRQAEAGTYGSEPSTGSSDGRGEPKGIGTEDRSRFESSRPIEPR